MARRIVTLVVAAVLAAALFYFTRDDASGQRASNVGGNGSDKQVAAGASEARAEARADDSVDTVDAVPDDAETTMTLAGGDVSMSYPDGFGLAVNQDQLLVSSYIPVCDEGFDYCIYLASGAYEGTNFDGAGLRVQLRDDLDYEAACMLEQPDGYSGLEPALEGATDHATSMFAEVGEGAAGHFTNGALYRLYFADTCYEFESRVGQTQFANFEPGAVERFEESELAELQGSFAKVIRSVSLPDGRDALWTHDQRPSTLVDDVQVRAIEPAADSKMTSPIELRGQALGSWFFEGSFPYRLQTAEGTVLASGVARAEGDWMTEGFVPFTATIEFDVEAATAVSLILMNDNPSGLPAN
ncbi:MAG TPA: Gmad2 immunoglobulin-like domain-containing protein, partial [Trueperaceae bacterium]|nr:Gmad2 immunoglobulin-like domain-containing protein [Trueperaceae bacterium]